MRLRCVVVGEVVGSRLNGKAARLGMTPVHRGFLRKPQTDYLCKATALFQQ